MNLCRSEVAAFKLSESARAALLRAEFDGVVWALQSLHGKVIDELLAAKAATEIADGVALTTKGLSLRSIVVRIAYRQRSLSKRAPGPPSRF